MEFRRDEGPDWVRRAAAARMCDDKAGLSACAWRAGLPQTNRREEKGEEEIKVMNNVNLAVLDTKQPHTGVFANVLVCAVVRQRQGFLGTPDR